MSRSEWKAPFLNIKILENKTENKKVISRNSEIFASFVGFTYNIYNGRTYSEITVRKEMVGHKFGEFSFTRAKYVYKKKKSFSKKKLKKK